MLQYHVEKGETKKECNEFHVLGTYMNILIYNEEVVQ